MARHTIEPERRTLHGRFDPNLAPALVIDPGDTVVFRTLDVSWGMEPPTSVTSPRKKFEPRDPVADDGPSMVGPILVRDAAPGDTIAIRIDRLDVGAWGWTYSGEGVTPARVARGLGIEGAPTTLVRWEMDAARVVATNQFGHAVRVRPFLGVTGVCPPGDGPHSGWTPSRFGGNTDCPMATIGSTIFLPVGVPGALVSVGDAHAAQGDGEIGGSAIECCVERGEMTISVRKGESIPSPRIRTPDAWVTLGFGDTVDGAMLDAGSAMVDVMTGALGVTRAEAVALASAAVDLRITQIVNGVVGAHAVWRDDALRASG